MGMSFGFELTQRLECAACRRDLSMPISQAQYLFGSASVCPLCLRHVSKKEEPDAVKQIEKWKSKNMFYLYFHNRHKDLIQKIFELGIRQLNKQDQLEGNDVEVADGLLAGIQDL